MITSLSIENFKCFSSSTQFNLASLNLFTGYNGRGKSSVFQALLLLAQSLQKNSNLEKLEVNGRFVNLDLFEDLINNDSKKETIRFTLNSDNSDYAKIKLGYEELSDRAGKIVELKINNINYFQKAASISEDTEKIEERHLYTYPKEFQNLFANYYYVSADRLGPTKYEEKGDFDIYNPVGCNGEHRLNVLGQDKQLLQEVSNWINYIMDGGTLDVEGNDNKQSAVLKLLFEISKNHNRSIKSINCGFGYSYILPIVITALSIKNGCLFIENPEAHLHPKAQSRLMELICKITENNKVQIFIETHSEHIINGVRLCSLKPKFHVNNTDVSIYFFDKDFSIYSLEMDEQSQISDWPCGFFDQQEIDISEILKLGLFK